MGLFSKTEKVPELPPAPIIPDLVKPAEKTPALPSSDGDSRDEINRFNVKLAVEDSFGKSKGDTGEQISPVVSSSLNSGERKAIIPPVPEIMKKPEMAHPSPAITETNHSEERKTIEDTFFVRIDKFQAAKKDLDDIKKRLEEINAVIDKINEIKQEEDKELLVLNEDLESIKNRISGIDSEFFNRI